MKSQNRKINEEQSNPLGRKRDSSIEKRVLESTIEILAEAGFDNMTIDMVVSKAKVGKASVYRRWSSKSDLV
ncbi:MAG: helix-turn-helix domain containing protein, partial [Spirochaetales bacterium]|nr:helix-turn-helix domain containing protein [Spirochaetales bacterium]